MDAKVASLWGAVRAHRYVLCTTVAQFFIGIWQFWLNSHSYELLPNYWFVHHSLFAAITFLLLINLGRHFSPKFSSGLAIVAVVGSLFTAGATSVFLPISQFLRVLFLLMSGSCLAVLQLFSVLRLMALDERHAFLSICVSSIAGSLGTVALPFLPGSLGDIVGMLMPAAAAAFIAGAGKNNSNPPAALYLKDSVGRVILGPLLCLMALRLAYSGANVLLKSEHGSFAYGPEPNHAITIFAGLIVVLWFVFLIYWVYYKKHAIDFLLLVKAPFVLMTLVFMFTGLWGSSEWLQIATFSTSCLASSCFLMLAIDVAQHSGLGHTVAASVVLIGDNISYYLGRCPLYGVLLELGHKGTMLDGNVSLVLLGVMSMAIVLATSPQSRVFKAIFHDLNNAPVTFESLGELDCRCRSVADRCGLSKRELEVMVYIVQGYTKPYIAEALIISDSTVRTHTRRLYEKVGVHSRRELQEMVSLEPHQTERRRQDKRGVSAE